MKPKTSIVVPVWNEEKYLEESLESIRRQTFEDFEVIVVDDCSKDRSPKIIKFFETLDPRFKKIKTPLNSGTGEALNLAFEQVRGEYQTWVSGDSWVTPDFLKTLVVALDEAPDVVMVYSDWLILNEIDKTTVPVPAPEFDKKKLQQECLVGPCWLFRATAKKKIGPYCDNLCEDYYMHLMMAEQGKMKRIPKTLGSWRDHPGNLTNTISRKGGWSSSVVARAKARWRSTLYRIAYISPVYTKEGWEFINLVNKLGDTCSVRHISSEPDHDLVIGDDDAEIAIVLAECHLVHLWGNLPAKFKVNSPILTERWAANPTLIPEYEAKYEKAINGTLRKQ
jgi:glycosyltransferase involved in cell wall biosynthesis